MDDPPYHRQITRREALRKTIVFSTGLVTAGRACWLLGEAPRTQFTDDGIDLLAFGDFGSKGDASQKAVAEQMAKFAAQLDRPLTAVLALGDNFYHPITPGRFEEHFEKMYSPEHLGCPFYACLGNHDYGPAYDPQENKPQIELDYAKDHPESRWKMPAKWYAVELPSSDNPLVKLVMLDGNYWLGALTPQEKLSQRRFLEAELGRPTRAPWLWAANHFPMFTQCAKKNRGDDQELIREWGPLLQSHEASLHFSGHDHTLQHLQVEGYSTSFIVSGSGGAELYEVAASKRGYAEKILGFNHIHVTRDRLVVQFIDSQGRCLHAFGRDREGDIDVKTGV